MAEFGQPWMIEAPRDMVFDSVGENTFSYGPKEADKYEAVGEKGGLVEVSRPFIVGSAREAIRSTIGEQPQMNKELAPQKTVLASV